MILIKNITGFFATFALTAFLYILYFFGKVYINEREILLSGDFVSILFYLAKVFFALSPLIAVLSIMLIGAGAKLKGKFSIILTVLIVTLMFCVYPFAAKYKYMSSFEKIAGITYKAKREPLILNGFSKYDDGRFFIKASKSDLLSKDYRHLVALDRQDPQTLYFSRNASLKFVEEWRTLEMENVYAYQLGENTNRFYENLSLSIPSGSEKFPFLDRLFAIHLLPYIDKFFAVFLRQVPTHLFFLGFIPIAFIFLLGVYILGASISHNNLRFHSILSVLFLYTGAMLLIPSAIPYLNSFIYSAHAAISDTLPSIRVYHIAAFLALFASLLLNMAGILLSAIFSFPIYYAERD